ncbi:unnamed protein product [Urochloa humidicola]
MAYFHDAPGDPGNRPHWVLAAALRTTVIREAQRDYELHAWVAVQVDARVPLDCESVFWDALHQLRVPEHALGIMGLGPALPPSCCNSAPRSYATGRAL